VKIGRCLVLMSISITVFTPGLSSWAQSSTTSLRGTVADPKGAVIVRAEVTLANPGTGFSRTVKTDEQGVYQFLEIPPNTYRLTIAAPGFAAKRIEGVRLMVNTPTTIDTTLKMEGGKEIVEVLDTPPLVNTQDATQGHAFDTKQIEDLPSTDREPVAILSLQPGVVFVGNQVNQGFDSRGGTVAGARSDQSNVTIDGIDNNDQLYGLAFQGALRATLDSLQEFRVITTNANADAGRSSGAQVALVTKSGTNQFHGSLYEYNRSSLGEANDWFLKHAQLQAGQPNLPVHLVRNTFGAAAGGPIKRDRLFFFASYEGQRTRENSIENRGVATDSFRQGLLSYQCNSGTTGCPANGVFTLSRSDLAAIDPQCSAPVAGFPAGTCPLGPGANPAILSVFQSGPLPNSSYWGDGFNIETYTFSAPNPAKLDTYIGKLDYRITDNGNHQLFVRGALQNDHGTGAPPFPGYPPSGFYFGNNKGITAGYTAVFRNNLINDFRYGFVRQGGGSAPRDVTDPQLVGIGVDTPHEFWRRFVGIIPVHNWVDNLSWTKGRHTLQFGANVRRVDDINQSNNNSFPSAYASAGWFETGAISGTGTDLDPGAPQFSNLGFPAVASGFQNSYDGAVMDLTGILSAVVVVYNETKTLSPLPQGAIVPRHFRATEAEWYAQDSWRATPNLTLTFGARYTLLQPTYETTGTQVAPIPGLDSFFKGRLQAMRNGQTYAPTIAFNLAGQANGKPPYWPWDYGNIAPRFAFAWSPKATGAFSKRVWGSGGKSSVRGGYGIYYDHFGEGVVNTFNRNGSFGFTTYSGNPVGSVTVDDAPRFSSLSTIPAFAAGGCQAPPCPLYGPPPHQSFPVAPPAGAFAITWGLDDRLKTPYSHVVNFSITRELPHKFVIEAAYTGRFAHRLLQEEDLAQPLDIRDPQSGMDYFTAATNFSKASEAQLPIQNMAPIAFWEHMFPMAAGPGKLAGPPCQVPGVAPPNPTATQNMYATFNCLLHNEIVGLYSADVLCFPACATINGTTAPFQFFDSQYASLWAWRTIGNSSYNSGQFSLRHRVGSLETDVNYTFSKSIDIGSNAERISTFEGQGFASQIINAWSPNQLRAASDFDTRHQINANWVYDIPSGYGRNFGSAAHAVMNALFANWSVSGLFHWTSGFPATVEPGKNWSTDYSLTSAAVQTQPTGPTGAFMVNGIPNLFQDPTAAVNAFRFAYPGESGQRNNLRGPGYFGIDLGVGKTWNISEYQSVKFRWETFNLTNTPRFDVGSLQAGGSNGFGNLLFTNSVTFGQFTSTLTKPRIMQFALRYSY
jgi:hypothetical protein